MIPVCGAESWGGWWRPVERTRFRLGWVLRSRNPDMVRQEIYGCLLAHHAISTLIWQAAAEADIDPDRVSFTRPDHPPDHRPQAARHDSGRVKRTSGKGTRHAGPPAIIGSSKLAGTLSLPGCFG